MNYQDKWRTIKELGEGGQGKVFLVERNLVSDLKKSLKELDSINKAQNTRGYDSFQECILKITEVKNKGALKVLNDLGVAKNQSVAFERIKKEIKIMSKNIHPNFVEILEADSDCEWYVSHYYEKGGLDKNLDSFKGDVIGSLKAFRPMVEAVVKLHEKKYVHRDIKPQNIFINNKEELVLGDFGLIYFEDDKTRLTETFENVGSRDWMPAWAQGMKLEDVNPSFDVFSLGKILWSMISGKKKLPLWYFQKEDYNIEKQFANNPEMKSINKLFEKCIVEDEKNCLLNAKELLDQIDNIIDNNKINSFQFDVEAKNTCKMCKKGEYLCLSNGTTPHITRNFGFNAAGGRKMIILECSNCGHILLFSNETNIPSVWKKQ